MPLLGYNNEPVFPPSNAEENKKRFVAITAISVITLALFGLFVLIFVI